MAVPAPAAGGGKRGGGEVANLGEKQRREREEEEEDAVEISEFFSSLDFDFDLLSLSMTAWPTQNFSNKVGANVELNCFKIQFDLFLKRAASDDIILMSKLTSLYTCVVPCMISINI